MAISHATEIIAFITAGGGLLWSGYKWLLKPQIKKAKEKKREYLKKIEDIHAELKFNGGTSIKDAVFKIQDNVSKIVIRMDAMEENQRLSMNLQGIAYWESDDSGLFAYASPGLCKMVGRSESELTGNNWMAWIHQEDKERVLEAWAHSVAHKTAFDEQFRFKMGDGRWVRVWGVAFPRVISQKRFGGKMGKLVQMEKPYIEDAANNFGQASTK